MKHRNIAQINYHQVVVAPALYQGVPDFEQGDSLVAPAGTAGFAVVTGIAMGPVELVALPSVDAGEWPEHTSIEIELGEPLEVHEWADGPDAEAYPDGLFAPDVPGRYRVDVYAKRRAKDYDAAISHRRRKHLERYAVVFTLLHAHPVAEVGPSEEPELTPDPRDRLAEREVVVLDQPRRGRRRGSEPESAVFVVDWSDDQNQSS